MISHLGETGLFCRIRYSFTKYIIRLSTASLYSYRYPVVLVGPNALNQHSKANREIMR